MKKAKLIFLAGLAMAVSLTGCQKKEVKPGDVAGYDAVSYTHLKEQNVENDDSCCCGSIHDMRSIWSTERQRG